LKKFNNIRVTILIISISEAYEKSIEKHVTIKNNRYVLSSFIDAPCYLAKQEFSFDRHDEQFTSTYRGNYVELIQLMSTFYPKISLLMIFFK